MGERVLVRFAGGGAGVGELSWGQRAIWHLVDLRKEWTPIGTVLPLPAGVTVADAVEDLRYVVSRYPSLRTTLRFTPAEWPTQVVAAEGEIPLEIVDAADGADPATVAAEVEQRYRERDYDFAGEWPLRMAVVRHRGALTHRVWVMPHLVTDGGGALVILRELAGRETAGTAMPPLEQARWQSSPAGQRQCAAALRHWDRVLRRVPLRRFPPSAGTPHPRYWQARFGSPALLLAIRALGARTGVEAPSVLLGLFAVALARVTGINPVVVILVVNNRFRPGLAGAVSPIIHPGLCCIDVPDGTVDQALALTRRRAITAYKYAYYDPVRLDEVIEQVNRDRGGTVDLESTFNDSRLTPRDRTGPPPTPEQVTQALSGSTFEWLQKQNHRPYEKLYITVDDVPDTIQLTVTSHAHYVPPADVEQCVRGMEELAVAAVLDPATRTGVPAP